MLDLRRLSDCQEWQLIQAVGRQLEQRKSPYSVRPQDCKTPAISPDAEFLEVELRRLLLVRETQQELPSDDFALFQETVIRICRLLESAVSPEVRPAADQIPYPRLRGLVDLLNKSDDVFDLVSGLNKSLFRLSDDQHQARSNLDIITEHNIRLARLLSHGSADLRNEPATRRPAPKERKSSKPWKDSANRNRIISILGGLFPQFKCSTPHELVMDISESVDESEHLHVALSSCRHDHDDQLWQHLRCSFIHGNHRIPDQIVPIPDICAELNQYAGPRGFELTVLLQSSVLFGAWYRQASDPEHSNPGETLEGLVEKGAFKPTLTYDSFKSESPTAPRFTPLEMRKLAVKLGYCLMDFFDADLDCKRFRFCSSERGIRKDRICLSFSSSLPAAEGLCEFRMGHPTLLSFAKLLLELYSGSSVSVEPISLCWNPGNPGNEDIWVKILKYLENLERERNDSFLRAVKGCLMVHTKITQKLRLSPGREDDLVIRKVLYKEVVRNLELGLEEATPRAHAKRRRSESPPSLSERGSRQKRPTLKASSHSGRGHRAPAPEDKEHRTLGLNFHTSDATTTPKANYPRPVTPSLVDDTIQDGQPRHRGDFEVAIICALAREAEAVLRQFDCFWDEDGDPYGKADRDPNEYRTGRVGRDNVVLLILPKMGKASAASTVSALLSSYTGVRLALVVGICGGVPAPNRHNDDDELVLGDVVISSAMTQFDFGRRYPNGFRVKDAIQDSLGKAGKDVQALLNSLATSYGRERLETKKAKFLEALQEAEIKAPERRGKRLPRYTYPGTAKDRLYAPTYLHKHQSRGAICGCDETTVCDDAADISCRVAGCDDGQLLSRERIRLKEALEKKDVRLAQRPAIHIGAIASGDTVMKSAEDRDSIARQHKVIAFEMEGAGIWDAPHVSCLVIKSVCDYADSHKNKVWQDFAAATAASAMKALLGVRARPDRVGSMR
ncbi:hypothetical protein QBC42DRAFT_277323 [Cladorrhinum samala]|uniref:Nucleoside phosphorylase domain-containing protein n=1 Tax=Cladorrhinum samala TaxID=585594 RepID=A0AAV9HAU9_9PEZI|nr:hypothetical protein QBC42DRAFT_277323 [Cladorrhinum samala]